MSNTVILACDGCGQPADTAHISRRLQRLEWATRFRPVHVQALLLGGVSPQSDDEYLYNPESSVTGEAAAILQAAHITAEGKSKEAVLTEFQKLGLLLTHVLECPLDAAIAERKLATAYKGTFPQLWRASGAPLSPSGSSFYCQILSGSQTDFARSIWDVPCIPKLPKPSFCLIRRKNLARERCGRYQEGPSHD